MNAFLRSLGLLFVVGACTNPSAPASTYSVEASLPIDAIIKFK